MTPHRPASGRPPPGRPDRPWRALSRCVRPGSLAVPTGVAPVFARTGRSRGRTAGGPGCRPVPSCGPVSLTAPERTAPRGAGRRRTVRPGTAQPSLGPPGDGHHSWAPLGAVAAPAAAGGVAARAEAAVTVRLQHGPHLGPDPVAGPAPVPGAASRRTTTDVLRRGRPAGRVVGGWPRPLPGTPAVRSSSPLPTGKPVPGDAGSWGCAFSNGCRTGRCCAHPAGARVLSPAQRRVRALPVPPGCPGPSGPPVRTAPCRFRTPVQGSGVDSDFLSCCLTGSRADHATPGDVASRPDSCPAVQVGASAFCDRPPSAPLVHGPSRRDKSTTDRI